MGGSLLYQPLVSVAKRYYLDVRKVLRGYIAVVKSGRVEFVRCNLK